MKSHLRRLAITLAESFVILVGLSVFYVAGYLACYQTLPRWK